jgi:hypothetical protein
MSALAAAYTQTFRPVAPLQGTVFDNGSDMLLDIEQLHFEDALVQVINAVDSPQGGPPQTILTGLSGWRWARFLVATATQEWGRRIQGL